MRLSKSFKGWSDQHVKFILYQARAELSLITTLAMLSCRNHHAVYTELCINP